MSNQIETFIKVLPKKIPTKKEGVFYKQVEKTIIDTKGKTKTTNIDKIFLVRYRDMHGKDRLYTVGKYSEGIREAYCKIKRDEFVTLAKNGELPPRLKERLKKSVLTLNQLAKVYFDDKRCLKCENCIAFDKLKEDEKLTNEKLECLDRRVKHLLNKYRKHIEPKFGKLNLETIKKDDIIKKRKSLITQGKAENTINGIIQLMSTIINYSIREKELKIVNPCLGVRALDTDNDRDRYLTLDEVNKLLDSIVEDKRLSLFVRLSLSTGGRLQTILNIKKKDINLSHNIVTLKDFKNHSTYTGFIYDELKQLLEDHSKHLSTDTYIIGERLTSLGVNALSSSLRPKLNKLFNEGLAVDDRKNRVVIHTLRHTFASLLAIQGTPIYTIKTLLNHKDIKMTLRYAKLAPDSGLDAVRGLYR